MKYIINALAFFGLIMIVVIILFIPSLMNTGDMFNWTVIEKKSNNNQIEAILEHGIINNGANTSPFYSVILKTKDIRKSVWQSQINHKPNIKWIDDTTLQITQERYLILEYEPEIYINGKIYKIQLKILPD